MKRTETFEPSPTAPTHEDLRELTTWFTGFEAAQTAGKIVRERHSYALAPPPLYLDTTIASFLTAWPRRDINTARMQRITREWWEEHSRKHLLYVSDLVVIECQRGDTNAARRRIDAIARLPQIHKNAQSYELASRILAQCRLPERVHSDAHHVAIAALNGVPVVLTWNCTHLANEHMIPLIRRACEAYGYAPPDLYTPEQLIGVCAYG